MKQFAQQRVKHPGVWQVSAAGNPRSCIATGHDALNQQLPAGGWQSEVIYEMSAHGQQQLLQSLEPALSTLSHQTGWLILLKPPKTALDTIAKMADVDPSRLLVVHGNDDFDSLWAAEQALVKNNAACILTWTDELSNRDVKRLKLAARGTKALSFVFPKGEASHQPLRWPNIMAHQYSANVTQIDIPVKENNQLANYQHCLH
ncbi:hypothetical protein GCM10011369_33260 [Neiella marina]|uniref:Translesion DNA synthesis-associated protein ImuA n=1 Tax=Neiella marina TaxID=508461 RepID=A0A8J2U9K6_9GAMM|nr:SulA-like leucine-rich domain-containing protein [Neiella marina]GGA88482.1 hypothetical protein GCM10011369_33260 [Neiella marina]